MRLLYLHGLGSGAESRTPCVLKKAFPEAVIDHPELPVSPKKAMEFLRKNYLEDDVYDLVIGTSLGGFFALALLFLWQKKLVINPAMFADEDIRNSIGLGEQHFFGKRSDGAQSYVIDETFLSELREIRTKLYARRDILRPEKMDHNEVNHTYALFGERDVIARHYNDFCALYSEKHAFRFDGEHRLTEENIREVLAPLIRKILAEPETPFAMVLDRFED